MVLRVLNPNQHVCRCHAQIVCIRWKRVLANLGACEILRTSTVYLEGDSVQRGLCLVKRGYILLRMLFVYSTQISHLCHKPRLKVKVPL